MKLVLAHPSYGSLNPQAEKSLRVAMMTAATKGVEWVGDVSCDRVGWAAARQNMARAFYDESGADGIFWCDDDMLIPADIVPRLLQYELDFVSGLYFQRERPHFPLAAVYDEERFHWWTEFPENVIAPCDGVGFGACYTSRRLFEEMAKLPEVQTHKGPNFFEWTEFSEDLTFCLRARKTGIRPHVDTALKCLHLAGPVFVGEPEFRLHQEAMLTGKTSAA